MWMSALSPRSAVIRSGFPTQRPPLFLGIRLRRLLHFYSVIDDQVHEFVEALGCVSVESCREKAEGR